MKGVSTGRGSGETRPRQSGCWIQGDMTQDGHINSTNRPCTHRTSTRSGTGSSRRARPADEPGPVRTSQGGCHRADPEAEEGSRGATRERFRCGCEGASDGEAAVRSHGIDQRHPLACGSLARATRIRTRRAGRRRSRGSGSIGAAIGSATSGPHSAGRGGGDRDLVDRVADPGPGGPPVSRSERRRQPRRQSGPCAAGAEARRRRRQDHCHGDDHRLADDQLDASPGHPAVHTRLPGGDSRRDDPGPAAGAPVHDPDSCYASREGVLLRRLCDAGEVHRH